MGKRPAEKELLCSWKVRSNKCKLIIRREALLSASHRPLKAAQAAVVPAASQQLVTAKSPSASSH